MDVDLIVFWVVWGGAVLTAAFLPGAWLVFARRGLWRYKQGQGTAWSIVMAHLSVLAAIVVGLRFGLLGAIAAALFPPAVLLALPDMATLAITPRIAAIALPVAVLVAFLALANRALRPFTVLLTGTALIATTPTAGEVLSIRAICSSAEAQGMSNVTRQSFTRSITNTGYEWQFDLHAMAERGEERFGWSYSTMGWYPLPDTIWSNVQSRHPACGS